MTRFILEELEEYGATYAEAYEALEGAKRQLNERLKKNKIEWENKWNLKLNY